MKFQLQFSFFSFAVWLLLLISLPALSQKIMFNKIFPPEGKTFEHVTGIVQDQQGYMWFASKKGLYRYDGYYMKSYKNNPLNTNSLVSNILESICTDPDGMIWVGSLGAGLDRLDPSTGNFAHFHHNSKDPASLSNDTVTTLLYDHEGTLWVGTHGGLDRFDPKANEFIHYRYDPKDSASISNNQVRSLYEDRQQTLWIGTGSPFPDNGGTPEDGGLNRLNKKNGKFIRYLHDPNNPNSLINNKVRAIFEDTRGTFWIGTGGNGLHTMDRVNGTFKRYPYNPPHPEEISFLPGNKKISNFSHITFITEDATGSIWIGTLDAGLSSFDPKTQKVNHYGSYNDSTGEFSGYSAWAPYNSRDGVLWISNLRGDLYKVDPFLKRLPHYESTYGSVSSFYQEPGGILWIGTYDGLIRKDTIKKTARRFVSDPLNPKTLSTNSIMTLKTDRQGRLWVGTQGGLNLYDTDNEIVTRYLHDPKNSNSLSNDFIVPIYEDRHQNLWIGTMRGLNLMNREKGSFTHYLIKPNDTVSLNLGPNLVTSVLEDRQGRLWIGAWGGSGVNQLNKESGGFENYLKGVSVVCIYEDTDGILWAGGEDGLYRFNPSSKIFSRFVDPGTLTGIPDIFSIVEDNKKNLWLGTISGIIRLNPKRNETSVYGENYGVKENTLIPTAAYKGRNGELFFGDTTGYFEFSPDQVTADRRPPEILLAAFRIANTPVQSRNNGLFTGLLWKTKQIKLDHNQTVFSFDFVSIDYSNPEANRTLFMLENYDNEWHIADKNGRAYYFNVPPGKYIFKIKSSNSHGVWAYKGIEITITPPWWRTWWAYILFAILSISLISGIIYYRSRNLIREKRYLEEKVKSRTAEVVKQKEEISIQRDNLKQALDELKATQAQLIQSEKMASLGELTAGIAHEIQNPLNFVNNFSEVNKELLDEMENELNADNKKEAISIARIIKENQEKISHHGKRAGAIVKGMLQHSRSSSGKKEPTDINALVDEYLRLSYHGLRAKDKAFTATMKADLDKSIGNINIIPQEIGRVLLNLFTNAFYAVTEKTKKLSESLVAPEQSGQAGYEPTVLVTTKRLNGKVGVSVRDNGNGIPRKVLDKIFQPFFTTKPTGQGTGLGLSISYDIIKLHGGELKVETKEGEFTEFIIILPNY
jgi:signal transduction histidine kinase/ligand-binding sensor domain-containing protein